METIYRVAVHYGEDCGYLEYDAAQGTAKVVLRTAEKRAAVEAFLAQEHEIQVPQGTLRDFSARTVRPLQDRESFQLALTRLWGKTEVYVDWSRPVTA